MVEILEVTDVAEFAVCFVVRCGVVRACED